MVTYIVRRLLWMIVLLLIISFLTFLIFSKLPSADPVALRAGRNATPELRASIKHTFGLDKPFLEQYRIYLAKLVPFDVHSGFKPPDFGYSYQNNVSVKSQILDRLPATAGLALGGMFVWLLVGIPIGIISAIRRGRIEDRLAMGARPRRDQRARLLARARLAVPVQQGHRPDTHLRRRRLVPEHRQPVQRPDPRRAVAVPPVDRARNGVRRDLCALPAREPARGDGRGLHPHRARQGPARSGR